MLFNPFGVEEGETLLPRVPLRGTRGYAYVNRSAVRDYYPRNITKLLWFSCNL